MKKIGRTVNKELNLNGIEIEILIYFEGCKNNARWRLRRLTRIQLCY